MDLPEAEFCLPTWTTLYEALATSATKSNLEKKDRKSVLAQRNTPIKLSVEPA